MRADGRRLQVGTTHSGETGSRRGGLHPRGQGLVSHRLGGGARRITSGPVRGYRRAGTRTYINVRRAGACVQLCAASVWHLFGSQWDTMEFRPKWRPVLAFCAAALPLACGLAALVEPAGPGSVRIEWQADSVFRVGDTALV